MHGMHVIMQVHSDLQMRLQLLTRPALELVPLHLLLFTLEILCACEQVLHVSLPPAQLGYVLNGALVGLCSRPHQAVDDGFQPEGATTSSYLIKHPRVASPVMTD